MDIDLAISLFLIRGSTKRHFMIFRSVVVSLALLGNIFPVNKLFIVAGLMANDSSDSNSERFSLKTIPKTDVPPKQSTCKYTLPRAFKLATIISGLVL